MYCAQYRLGWVQSPGSTGPLTPPFNPSAQMRGEVRVFWSRLERNPIGLCSSQTLDANPNNYQVVYATTMIRENTAR